jgi:hypothetical protein
MESYLFVAIKIKTKIGIMPILCCVVFFSAIPFITYILNVTILLNIPFFATN